MIAVDDSARRTAPAKSGNTGNREGRRIGKIENDLNESPARLDAMRVCVCRGIVAVLGLLFIALLPRRFAASCKACVKRKHFSAAVVVRDVTIQSGTVTHDHVL
jgi:hypothetical protein